MGGRGTNPVLIGWGEAMAASVASLLGEDAKRRIHHFHNRLLDGLL